MARIYNVSYDSFTQSQRIANDLMLVTEGGGRLPRGELKRTAHACRTSRVAAVGGVSTLHNMSLPGPWRDHGYVVTMSGIPIWRLRNCVCGPRSVVGREGRAVIGAQRCFAHTSHRGAPRRGTCVCMESESDTESSKSTRTSLGSSVRKGVQPSAQLLAAYTAAFSIETRHKLTHKDVTRSRGA